MEIKSLRANQKNYGGKRSMSAIKYIVIHYTANDGDRAVSNGRYFRDNVVNASAHYFVDDTEIIQSVPDHRIAWSVGGNKYPSSAKTGGGKWHGKCTNANSISIELCDTKKNGVSDFTEATMANAAELCKMLMKKYSVPIENVIRHFDVVGKICPKPFVENEGAWKTWKERLVEDEMVDQVKIIIDGKTYEVNRILKDGTNYVKIRDIADAVGYDISSNGSIPVLTWKKWKERLVEDEMVDQVKIIIDGKTYEVNRILKDGTNYVKIRDIADAVGYDISSNGSIPVLTWKKWKERLEEDEMVDQVKIIIDGKTYEVNRILKDGTNYVKIRDIADAVGYDISSNGSIPVLKKK